MAANESTLYYLPLSAILAMQTTIHTTTPQSVSSYLPSLAIISAPFLLSFLSMRCIDALVFGKLEVSDEDLRRNTCRFERYAFNVFLQPLLFLLMAAGWVGTVFIGFWVQRGVEVLYARAGAVGLAVIGAMLVTFCGLAIWSFSAWRKEKKLGKIELV